MTALRNCWLRADPNHMARLATEIEYGPDFLIAHFSDGAVRDLREHARDSRPCPWKLSGREALVRLSFDTAETATAFLLLILELGGELAPQAHLPASATGDLVP
ncbi:hypothetical protein [Leisingera caerulea]|uniref:Uncharacterized protein n=1 Tax=Leisingera caerulea TaxID=506591 RepID=A0A9Q9M429_LEICA|nr:hypothetical protein [Leisingera caerulea]UWQ54999.1 hypothetical protein K3721_05550 [Leisingera caerulea]